MVARAWLFVCLIAGKASVNFFYLCFIRIARLSKANINVLLFIRNQCVSYRSYEEHSPDKNRRQKIIL